MCGIVGYVGFRPAANVIVDGLQKLEYRGYDSFGVATNNPCIEVYKCEGKISEKGSGPGGSTARSGSGIRGGRPTACRATGTPTRTWTAPGQIAVVHNGIIENYAALTRELTARGHVFRSETDTEVVAHLIEECYDGSDLRGAVEQAITRLEGSYALLVTVEGSDEVVAARDSSPLVLGIGDLEVFAASDVTPLLGYTERVVYLEDGDLAEIDREGWRIYSRGSPVQRPVEHVDWDVETVKKGGFPHFMLKEIFEQPKVFYDTLHGVTEASLPERYRRPSEITVVACGSSYHAGLVFKYLCESTCRIPVRAELGSEFKYFTPPLKGIVTVITQSGETADTLAALKKAQGLQLPDARDHERARLDRDPDRGPHGLHARGARDLGRGHQVVHRAARGPDGARGPDEGGQPVRRGPRTGEQRDRGGAPARHRAGRSRSAGRPSTSSTSGAASSTRSRSRGRSR